MTGSNNMALGTQAGRTVFGSGNIAIGVAAGNGILANNTLALGANAKASVSNDAAIGNGAVFGAAENSNLAVPASSGYAFDGVTPTYAGNVASQGVSFGTAAAPSRLVNVAAGRVSASSTDAVNGSQLYALSAAVDARFASAHIADVGAVQVSAAAVTAQAVPALEGSTTGSGTALGVGAQANGANSVAIGGGSIATAPNTVSFGSPGNERRLTNVAPGIAGTDAVNVNQLNAAVYAQAQTNSQLRTQMQADTSVALAVSGIHYVDLAGHTSVGGALSGYEGQTGMAFGIGHVSANARWRYNAAASFSPSHQSGVGVVVGATYQFGQ